MVRSRTITALAGLIFGIVVSVAAWVYLETVLLFLFLPFVPFLFGGGRTADGDDRPRAMRQCPQCSFRTTDPEFEYCPRDGPPCASATTGETTAVDPRQRRPARRL